MTNPEGTLKLDLLVSHPGGSRLVDGFVSLESEAMHFYPGSYRDPASYVGKAGEVDGRFDRAARERAASYIHAPTEVGRGRLQRMIEEGGYFVTTGQQPGLLGGPLYTLYKALTAVRLAEELEGIVQRPVLPLFWIASEDHDWEESSHTFTLDLENEPRRLELPYPGSLPDQPLHRLPLGDSVEGILEELAGTLPDTDFSAGYLEMARSSYPRDATLPQGFGRVLEQLLEPFHMLFVRADQPDLKRESLSLMLSELDRGAENEALLLRNSRSLQSAGFHVQVPILEGSVNLFLEGKQGRERVLRSDDGFALRHSREPLDLASLVERVEADPSLLSPNVLLRPVVESAAFPVISYVGGPGEIAYFAQLGDYFKSFGIHPPVVFPRFSVTVVESKIQKVMDKFGLSVQDLRRPHHELAGEIAREEMPDDIQRALGEIRGAIGKGSGEILGAAMEIDPTLKGPITHARNQAFAAFQEAEKKVVQGIKRRSEIALSQIGKAQNHLYPLGKPQERVLNAFYYLARYGPAFLPAVAERFAVDLGIDVA